MKKAIAIGAASVAAIALLAAFGGRYYQGRHDPKQAYQFITNRVNSMLDEIKATDEQRTQINSLKDKLWQEGMSLKTSHQGLHQDLMALWDADKVDPAQAHALVDQRIDALRAFAHDAVDSGIQLHNLLTPEQRQVVKSEMQKHHEHHPHGD
jgi:Spy/CpxP family protein refolding chaperone